MLQIPIVHEFSFISYFQTGPTSGTHVIIDSQFRAVLVDHNNPMISTAHKAESIKNFRLFLIKLHNQHGIDPRYMEDCLRARTNFDFDKAFPDLFVVNDIHVINDLIKEILSSDARAM